MRGNYVVVRVPTAVSMRKIRQVVEVKGTLESIHSISPNEKRQRNLEYLKNITPVAVYKSSISAVIANQNKTASKAKVLETKKYCCRSARKRFSKFSYEGDDVKRPKSTVRKDNCIFPNDRDEHFLTPKGLIDNRSVDILLNKRDFCSMKTLSDLKYIINNTKFPDSVKKSHLLSKKAQPDFFPRISKFYYINNI